MCFVYLTVLTDVTKVLIFCDYCCFDIYNLNWIILFLTKGVLNLIDWSGSLKEASLELFQRFSVYLGQVCMNKPGL